MDFNPRTPCGVRPLACVLEGLLGIFQSTHPVRGATNDTKQRLSGGEFQSTHPVRGATGVADTTGFSINDFNPRTPCGVRRHPLSILPARHRHFNPRTPCGVRLHNGWIIDMVRDFNPRTPCGVRRYPLDGVVHFELISIHAPRAGCDRLTRFRLTTRENFNPRTPCGVRLHHFNPIVNTFLFQSTHPVRGATYNNACTQRQVWISIHAPRAGCDRWPVCWRGCSAYFNPRTPCGVRQMIQSSVCLAANFNPRTPCGVRPASQTRQGSQ